MSLELLGKGAQVAIVSQSFLFDVARNNIGNTDVSCVCKRGNIIYSER